MYVGLDLGSRNVKMTVSLKQKDGQFSWPVRWECFDTFAFYTAYASYEEQIMRLDLHALGLEEDASVAACGYGKQAAAIGGALVLPEIQAHALGAHAATGKGDFLLIDIGGQDSKVIRVIGNLVRDFSTNDKCAAGSGRYLENMGKVLGLDPVQLGSYWQEPVLLNSTCAVFGESELVGKIIEGFSLSSLAAGVNQSVVRRLLPLIHRHLPAKDIYLVGGVAQNEAVCRLLSRELGQTIKTLPQAQFNGALGCCYYAWQKKHEQVSSN